jgi:hypothetical protein
MNNFDINNVQINPAYPLISFGNLISLNATNFTVIDVKNGTFL